MSKKNVVKVHIPECTIDEWRDDTGKVIWPAETWPAETVEFPEIDISDWPDMT